MKSRRALKIVAIINPRDALTFKHDVKPIDLSSYNASSLWVYPNAPKGTFSVDVGGCVWADQARRGKWFTVGHVSHANAPNRQRTHGCFHVGEIPRTKVLRVLHLVARRSTQV